MLSRKYRKYLDDGLRHLMLAAFTPQTCWQGLIDDKVLEIARNRNFAVEKL